MQHDLTALRSSYLKASQQFDQALLRIPVAGSDEPLVSLASVFPAGSPPVVASKNSTTLFYLRKGPAEALAAASAYFGAMGYLLRVESAYRSLTSQRELFKKRVADMRQAHPGATLPELLAHASTYTAGIPVLAAHTAGAAVDVVLSWPDGTLLDFGVPYRHGDVESVTDFPNLSSAAKENRRILREGMERLGWVNYPFEYWHYSIGDVAAAYVKKESSALYEPVDFDPQTGHMNRLHDKKSREFFDIEEHFLTNGS